MTTSRVRPHTLRPAISRLALAVAAGLVVCAPAPAQDNGLRGAITARSDGLEPLPTDSPLPSQRPRFAAEAVGDDVGQAPPPRYRPVSQGALPDEDPSETELEGYVSTASGDAATNDITAARLTRRARREQAASATNEAEQAASAAESEQPGSLRGRSAGQSADGEASQLTTGTVRASTVDANDEERNVAAEATAERAQAIEGLRRGTEEDPYAAPGITVGTFILRPTLQQGIEWSSNVQSTAGGSADFLSSTSLSLDARSQWSRHSAALSLDGTYRTSITGTGFSEFTGSADADVGIDVGNDYRLNAGAGYSRGPEEATSPTVISGTLSRALRQTLTASLGAEKHAGTLRAALTGEVARNTYGDATLSGGGTVSQTDRNNTLYSATLRGGYEISPALVPFVELEYGRRAYDRRLDSGGYARSANIYGARAGLEFDMGEKLNGELSAGWLSEDLDDARLATISALSVDADVNWSPVRGTLVNLNAGTEVEGSTSAGSSGSVLYDATLSVSRELRANLTGNASLGVGWRRYAASADRDLTLDGEISMTWWMNRYAGLTGKASHERVSSNVAGRASQTTTVFLGLTLRR